MARKKRKHKKKGRAGKQEGHWPSYEKRFKNHGCHIRKQGSHRVITTPEGQTRTIAVQGNNVVWIYLRRLDELLQELEEGEPHAEGR